MKKLIYILSGVLVLQLLLTVTLNAQHSGIQGAAKPKALLALQDNDIDHISISGNDGKVVNLAKTNGKWLLSDQSDFPANQQQVTSLLAQILSLKHGLAVADSDNAAHRFKVAKDGFERKVVLSQQQVDMATLYLGTSASMRETHLRLEGETQVYLANLPVYRLPVTNKEWMQQDLLQLKNTNIKALTIGDTTLSRVIDHAQTSASQQQLPAAVANNGKVQKMVDKLIDDNGNSKDLKNAAPVTSDKPAWQLTPLAAGNRINLGAVNQALQQLSSLRVSDLLGVEPKANFGLDKPLLQFTVQRNQGDDVSYRLGQMSGSKDYVLKSSLSQQYFRLPQAQGTAFAAAFNASAFSEPLTPAKTDKAKLGSNPPKTVAEPTTGPKAHAK
ncbi:DUF4340 domain-containing protein [Shewanella dokdonensis]|uniref:DUF4340 domain-containing protein n=1 Tax=Shewanella dokdonensis TaxID=712036 RepID=A0ABX8DGI5_9GAMM|nr:DUF4340 domain-containing protein [Shewanella dokdonensis]MCL1074074.1 DUF4340 domain-containing protein [Shewanella dokdonensis]QVK23814.1 DUF4340 domain-containing protein [Shewanella dokdonensis]